MSFHFEAKYKLNRLMEEYGLKKENAILFPFFY